MKLIIQGRPASKKNNRKLVPRGKAIMSFPSQAYQRFEEDALGQLLQQKPQGGWKSEGFFDAIYTFYQKGKLIQDADNAMASINDVLEKAGVIENDKNIISGGFMIIRGSLEWKTELEITHIT